MNTKLDKIQVKELYLKGFKIPEIAKKLNSNKEAIKKCIQRNFGNLKDKHDIAAVRRREVLRAVNYEANKFMGDSTFVRRNRSIYRTNPNGDIVINKEVAPIVTWDTPRRLTNENKNKY